LATSRALLVGHALHTVRIHLLHAERVVLAAVTAARATVRVTSSTDELLRTILAYDHIFLATHAVARLL
jgi:hypothetical protein